MEFRLLGLVEAARDDRTLPLGGAKPRALLALFLLHANEVVSRDRLIEALWHGRAPDTADHSLDVQISRLRKALAPDELLLTRSGGYVLEVEPEAIDACRFERLLDAGRRSNAAGKPQEALQALAAALALWRGDALGDLAYEDFARPDAERLDQLRLVAIEERIDAELALGRHDTLIAELEALRARHPLRERLLGQLMLALYRGGRQTEALRVYSDARNRLVDELGIEPGPALRALEQAILRQDPALEVRRPPSERRRIRALAGAAALALAGVTVAIVVGLTRGGTERAQALAEPDSAVFVAADGGDLVRVASVRDPVRVAYGSGALWSISATGELTRVDPATGEEVARLGLGVVPSGLAIGARSVWVTGKTSPTVFRIDPAVNEVVDRFPLPMGGVVTEQTGEVAVGAGSVWIGHGAFNPGAWVERLDPETGHVQKRFSILAGDVDHLAFGEGALWVASTPSGELRKIDPRTNEVVFKRVLQSQLCCVAAGGGFVWAASNPDGVIWKLTTSGRVLPTIELHAPVQGLAYGDGALWAALGDEGKAIRIDPTTDEIREYTVGHSVTSVDADDGVVAAGVRQSIADVTGALTGDVARVAKKGPELFDSGAPVEPAFVAPTWDAWQEMFHYATCARLVNYPDKEGEAGRTVVPDVAEDLPAVSDGGRTYTFAIRMGFRFSPPSNEQVTAESFRRAIERALSPKLSPSLPPPLANIVGADAYRAGRAAHVSGVSARGRKLVIRLREPAPDVPWLVAESSCAVPEATPIVEGGLEKPVPSAGPYYLAALTETVAVLKRNPNYGGSRPQHLDAIVVELNVPPAEAATRIEAGTLDYFLESQNPTLRPNTQAAHSAGDRYRLTPYLGVHYFTFGYHRPLFADVRMRRAVQFALDRQVLAEADPAGGLPATRVLARGVHGYDETPLYPHRRDLRAARRFAAGREGTAVVYTWIDPGHTDTFNYELRRQLAAIGIDTKFVAIDQARGFEPAKGIRADLVWGGLSVNSADPGAYLQQLSYLPPRYSNDIRRITLLESPARERAAAALVRAVERDSLLAVFQQGAIPELVARRVGCVVHQPEYAGVDLAALCLKRS